MQVSSTSTNAMGSMKETVALKPLYTEKLSKDEAQEIRDQLKQNANAMAFNSASMQGKISSFKEADDFAAEYESFTSFLKEIGYNGKPIAELSQEEASELVSDDGFFGIEQTAKRISDFVINGAAGDEGRFRAGREGMIQGFKEAEEMWGGELPEISQKTMQKAIEAVDKAMYDLGFSILDKEV